jgi:hypothetical protein
MGAAVTRIIKVLQEIAHFLDNPWGYCGVIFSSIFILIYQCIQNPQGEVNNYMIILIDIIVTPLPSTPENLKLSYLLNQMYAMMPNWMPTSAINEIMQGIGGMLGLFLFVKLYKMLPFT